MSLNRLVESAVAKIEKTLPNPLTETQVNAISKVVEEALISAVNESSKNCATAAVVCCGPEADLAHKIAEDVERARHALVANLMSMR